MTLLKDFIFPRFMQWVVVVFVGVTLTFLIPRLSPVNPVDQAINRLSSFQTLDPDAALALRQSIEDLYGLNGTVFEQYFSFWGRVLRGDLGPSFLAFPTPVSQMIGTSIGWTAGLLGVTTLISWSLGLVLGSLAGYFSNRWWSEALEKSLVVIYPIPYFILAFILLMLFAFYWPIFPLVGGGQGTPAWTFAYIGSVIKHGFLPGMSIIIGAVAFRFIISKALTSSEKSSDYVQYAEMGKLPQSKILFSYVTRNTMLPQVTDLGLTLGTIFGGALITEVVFSYPGVGYLLLGAINAGDYNLIMGITLLSIVGIATASLLVDLSYPFLDPRVRYH
jgi:peptide/nickel transport system permease protein